MPRNRPPSRQACALLAAMLGEPLAWRHGYELTKATGLASGTLYPLLMRLSGRGFLEARWEAPERPGLPPRHGYRLTPTGLAFAREQAVAAQPAPSREAMA